MIKFDLSNLTKREVMYFHVMMSGLVLYIRGVPGMAKSAIGESMCRKIIWWDDEDPLKTRKTGIQYIDLRLSDKDETDLGSYPVLKNAIDQLLKFGKLVEMGIMNPDEFQKVKQRLFTVIDGDDIDQLNFAVPDWAIKANSTLTIIHVEELNRCDIRVRNAALQLLNEKRIGTSFKFNNNVLWMASGNLGDTDKTEVEEMDLALSNRLVIMDHDLIADEWAQSYGRENCWDVLVDYLVNHPDEFYTPPPDGDLRYATARSWTHLSDYVLKIFGTKPDLTELVMSNEFQDVGTACVGVSFLSFFRYCQDTVHVSIIDIYDKWDSVKNDVMTFNRSRTTELMNNLKSIKLETLQKRQVENIVKFLKSMCLEWSNEWEYLVDENVYYDGFTYRCKNNINKGVLPTNNKVWERISETDPMKSHSNDDEITNYLIHLVDTLKSENQEVHRQIVRIFKNKAELIQEWVNNGRHTNPDGTPKMK